MGNSRLSQGLWRTEGLWVWVDYGLEPIYWTSLWATRMINNNNVGLNLPRGGVVSELNFKLLMIKKNNVGLNLLCLGEAGCV